MAVFLFGCVGCQGPERAVSRSESVAVETWGTTDMEFRRIARVLRRPEYPTVSLGMKRRGVVVAEVIASEEGHVGHVDVLEAPDAHLGDAVRGALAGWEIEPPVDDEGRAVRLRAKLFFYFVIENGEGFVRSPEEMLRESGVFADDRRTNLTP